MGWVLRTKNDVNNPTLPGGVYGKYITIGRGFYFFYDGSRTRFGIFISDGGRYGLDSIESVEYKGAPMDEDDWILHRGTITRQIAPINIIDIDIATDIITTDGPHGLVADDLVRLGVVDGNMPTPTTKDVRYKVRTVPNPDELVLDDEPGLVTIDFTDEGTGQVIIWKADAGFDDPEQGLPTFIPEINTTLSGIAYVEGKLTSGQSDPVDPPDWDDFRIIGTGRRLMDYDDEGTELGIIDVADELSNLPLQVIDNFLVNHSGKHSRIDWPSWRQFREDADIRVWQRVIHIDDETAPTTENGFTARYYLDHDFEVLGLTRQEGTVNHPSSTLSPGPGIPNTGFAVRYTATIKAKYSELTTFKFIHDDAVKFWIDGNLIVDEPINGTHTADYTLIADQYYDVTIELLQFTSVWAIVFKWSSSSLAEEIVPASSAAPSDVLVKRYENHAAFPIAIEATEVMERLMERAPGWDWTDDEGLIKFLPPDRPVSFAFDFDRMDDDNSPTFLKQTFNKKRRSLVERPNFLLFRFRDALQTGYPFSYVQSDREHLRLFTNGEPTNNPAEDLGVMTRSLAERMAEMEMVLKSDPEYLSLISGSRASGKLRKNHFVTARYIDSLNNTVVDDKFIVTFHAWGSKEGRNDFSLLPIPTPYYSDEAFTWTPSDLIEKVVARWKASEITGLTEGQFVSTWEDIVGAFDATQTGGNRPVYRANSGDPYVEFDGSNDYLNTTLNTAFGDFTVFMIARINSTGTATAERLVDKNFASGFWMGISVADVDEVGGGIMESSPPYGHFLPYEAGEWVSIFMQRSGTSKNIRVAGSSVTQTVSGSATDASNFIIGALSGGGNHPAVDIKEIAVFNDNMTADELSNLQLYSLQEYGLML